MTLELSPRDVPGDRDPETLVRGATLRPGVRRDALVRYLAALPAARRAFARRTFSEPLPEAQLAAALDDELT